MLSRHRFQEMHRAFGAMHQAGSIGDFTEDHAGSEFYAQYPEGCIRISGHWRQNHRHILLFPDY
jgi:hypothetical protein